MELAIADLKRFLPALEAVLDDEAVSEVMVNGPGTVFVGRAGRISALEAPELTAEAGGEGGDPDRAPAEARIRRPTPSTTRGWRTICAWRCAPPPRRRRVTIRRFRRGRLTIEQLKASGSLAGGVWSTAPRPCSVPSATC